jgi:uncharacterized protein (TIGR02246 family)
MNADSATRQELEALETKRCAASAAGDTATLAEIFAPDMTFVHFRGKTESRDEYVTAVGGKPRSMEFAPMTIKLFGDVALMTGNQDITRRSPTGETKLIETFATRILTKADGNWRYVFIQVSPRVV